MAGVIGMAMVKKRIFIAGVIQGSCRGKDIHNQNYRSRLKAVLQRAFPSYDVYCPVENHPNSVEYPIEEVINTFNYHIDLVKESGLVVAYLPTASMGTAVEMWEAYKKGVEVWAITPMKENWVVRITATKVFETIEELEHHLEGSH
jgi:nucleoside 2-deoxyribosyltransferase